MNNEDFPLEEVPLTRRKGFWSLLWVLAGFTFFSATMFAGAKIGSSFSFFPDLLAVILIGNLILGCYVAILGYIAAKTGLNTVLLARFSFGNVGSRIVDLVLGLTQVLWYAWGTGFIAQVFASYIGVDSTNLIYVMMIVFGFAFCATAIIGYRGLEVLSMISVPVMTILIITSIVIATGDAENQGGVSQFIGSGEIPFAIAITAIVGTFISGGTQSTNWTRFAKTPANAVWTSLLAFLIVNGLMVFMGAYGALIYEKADISDIFIAQGLFTLGIIILFLNIWTTQDNTIYNFSVAGSNFFRTNKRRLITLSGAAIGTIIALFGFHNAIVPFTIALSTFIPPIGGIIMADYFFVHRGRYPRLSECSIVKINISGIISYGIACLTAYYSPFIPPIVGIISAFILHSIIGNFVPRKGLAE